MLMVEVDPSVVERKLLGGDYACPDCEGELRPWWFARWRKLRHRDRDIALRPRRSICRGCGHTHVLQPTLALLRRRDLSEMIGEALALKVAGWGYRRIARGLGVPPSTVRGWGRRFGDRAEGLRAHFTALVYLLDASFGPIDPRGSPQADALEAIVAAAGAAARRFGEAPLWHFAAGASGGRLLSNTNSPLLTPWIRRR